MNLTVSYKGRSVLTLNKALVSRQKLTEDDVEKLKELHVQRMDIEASMRRSRSPKTLKKLFAEWTENQFALQRTWKFPEDANFHRFWEVPKCTCPEFDNRDALGTPYRVINRSCPVHGEPNE